MTHIIYRKSDSRIMSHRRSGKQYYESERLAKGALTKMLNAGHLAGERDEYDVAELDDYRTNIEQYETVINIMSGKEVRQSVNTPRCCDPSSELYWSM